MDLFDRIRNAKPGEVIETEPEEKLPTVLVKRTSLGVGDRGWQFSVEGSFDEVRRKLDSATGRWVEFELCEGYNQQGKVAIRAGDVVMIAALPDFQRPVRPGD